MSNKTPLITVYITNYNYARFIRNAIDSVLNQTFQAAATNLVLFAYPYAQAEHRKHAAHRGHRLTRSSICFFFLNKMPHLIKLHNTDGFNLSGLGTKFFNIVPSFSTQRMIVVCGMPVNRDMPRKPTPSK